MIDSHRTEATHVSAVLRILPILLYLFVAVPAGILTLERFNSDGVCYLHRAMLLAGGDVRDAISAYWSPGLILSTVPLLKIGVDPLHAIHMTLLAWGAVYVLGAMLFFGQSRWGVAASAIAALVAVRLSTPIVTPDVLLGAAMLFYLAVSQRRWWFAAGLIAGAGYLGKAYFLPFFLVQFPLTILWKRVGWRPLGMGVLGFVIVAGPWIGVLSAREGRLTFSTATNRNRFMQDVAPSDVARAGQMSRRCRQDRSSRTWK